MRSRLIRIRAILATAAISVAMLAPLLAPNTAFAAGESFRWDPASFDRVDVTGGSLSSSSELVMQGALSLPGFSNTYAGTLVHNRDDCTINVLLSVLESATGSGYLTVEGTDSGTCSSSIKS